MNIFVLTIALALLSVLMEFLGMGALILLPLFLLIAGLWFINSQTN